MYTYLTRAAAGPPKLECNLCGKVHAAQWPSALLVVSRLEIQALPPSCRGPHQSSLCTRLLGPAASAGLPSRGGHGGRRRRLVVGQLLQATVALLHLLRLLLAPILLPLHQ